MLTSLHILKLCPCIFLIYVVIFTFWSNIKVTFLEEIIYLIKLSSFPYYTLAPYNER